MTSARKPRSPGEEVLRFLDDHRLDHSPVYYAFAHRYLFGDDQHFKAEVTKIIGDGVRITADQIGRLESATAPRATIDTVAPQLDAITARVLDIIGDALNATGTLNRDLVKATASLLGSDTTSIRTVLAAMIERTATAETSLAQATTQAQRLREELSALRTDAARDRLTGLVNRAAMEEHLAAALALPGGCCAAFVDIDHFKSINDTYGHGVGDRVLKVVATTLGEVCLPHMVARWGGEEFVVLFEGTSLSDSAATMQRARETLCSKRLKLRETDQPLGAITFSAGVVASTGRSAANLIEAADALLYEAKRQGRNMVLAGD